MKNKKIILITALIFSFLGGMAQATFTVEPAIYKAKDSVKVIVDVTNVPTLVNESPLYIWAFLNKPANPFALGPDGVPGGNGDWTNSNEAMRMTDEGSHKWSFKFLPTAFFNTSVANIVEIGFLVKGKDGSGKQTADLFTKPQPSIFNETEFRVFPATVSEQDVVTVNFNQSLTSTLEAQRMIPQTVEISAYSVNSGTETQIDVTKTNLTAVSANNKLQTYSYTFIPRLLFTVPDDKQINRIKYRFAGASYDTDGHTITVYTDWASFDFTLLTY